MIPVVTFIIQLLSTCIDDNSLRTCALQNEAGSSDGQESSEEAELKRKKIEAQKVIVEREEMELLVLKFASYLMKFFAFHFAINSLFMHPLIEVFVSGKSYILY